MGREVHRIRIAGGGLTASILTYGAVLQDLRLAGHDPALVLGFEEMGSYLADSPYFGATAGALREPDQGATFDLDGAGVPHRSERPWAAHAARRVGGGRQEALEPWRGHRVFGGADDGGPGRAHGFPGEPLDSRSLLASPLGRARHPIHGHDRCADARNLAHHSYFVLDDTGGVQDHRMGIDADHYLPTDADFVPTGAVQSLDGHPYDFRQGRTIREANAGGPIDANFCLSRSRQPIRPVGWVSSATSGVEMVIRTTEPGLQVYDAARIDVPVPGLDGRKMGPFCGLALEPQVWPDAVHHEDWPQAVLRPGETYDQHTQFIFRHV